MPPTVAPVAPRGFEPPSAAKGPPPVQDEIPTPSPDEFVSRSTPKIPDPFPPSDDDNIEITLDDLEAADAEEERKQAQLAQQRGAGPVRGSGTIPSHPMAPAFNQSHPTESGRYTSSRSSRANVLGRLQVIAGPLKGQNFPITQTSFGIGRGRGEVQFLNDPTVSPLHATIIFKGDGFTIRDEASSSGVYVSIGTEALVTSDQFSIGNRRFRFTGRISPRGQWNGNELVSYGAPFPNQAPIFLFEELLIGNRPGRGLAVSGPKMTFGRSGADFSFPDDVEIDALHCELALSPQRVTITNLSQSSGTFIRIQGERTIRMKERFRIGHSILALDLEK